MRSTVFVGTYTENILFGTGKVLEGKGGGIYVLEFNADTGELQPLHVIRGVRNPSYLAFHPSEQFLYCVNEFKEFQGMSSGAVSAFALHPKTLDLTFLNQKPSHGTDPCHLSVDPSGKFMFVTNFASGSVSVYPIQFDGSLGDASDVKQHRGSSVDPVRQTGPHAHAVTLDIQGRFVYVPDLGLDQVLIYELDSSTGELKETQERYVATAPGAGPRQLVMHPNQAYGYLINELDSTVSVYAYSASTGALNKIQTISTLPEDYKGDNTCAEVQLHPSGTYLLGSNRGHDSIVTFALDPASGKLSLIVHQNTKGKTPRNFTISKDGKFVFVANQDSDTIVVFRFDASKGVMQPQSEYRVPTPVCVKFL